MAKTTLPTMGTFPPSKHVEDAQLNGDDLIGVNTQYKGVIDLSQVEFPAGCLNDDAPSPLNGINIFSIGAADASSVVYARSDPHLYGGG